MLFKVLSLNINDEVTIHLVITVNLKYKNYTADDVKLGLPKMTNTRQVRANIPESRLNCPIH